MALRIVALEIEYEPVYFLPIFMEEFFGFVLRVEFK